VIIAQRLVRKICEMCKTSIETTTDELTKNLSPQIIKKHFGDKKAIRIYQGAGCKVCHTTGYTGRIGLFEVLEVTPTLRKLITNKADIDVMLKQAVEEGMATMLDDGMEKVVQGITTIEEVLRVTKTESV
jgi:type II secretory ATPase GspE/PulE/Tfp pilus assembly ATPase PilB-like protein